MVRYPATNEPFDDPDFHLEDLPIDIHCPKCGNERVHDGNSLQLAYSPRGAMFERGTCGGITQRRFPLDPLVLERVERITWGGHVQAG